MADITAQQVMTAFQTQFDYVLYALKNDTSLPEKLQKDIAKVKSIFLYNEQAFKSLKDDDITRNRANIYIVVKFGKGSANYGAMNIPVSFTVFGYPNSIDATQVILMNFVNLYTTNKIGELSNGNMVVDADSQAIFSTSTQVWRTPNVFSNFNEIEDHFRSTFSLDGVIILGYGTVSLDSLKYYPNGIVNNALVETDVETILFMQIDSNYSGHPSPQPFGNTFGFTKSEIDFASDSISMAMYMTDTQLLADLMFLKGYKQTNALGKQPKKTSINDDFVFIMTLSNGFSNNHTNNTNNGKLDDNGFFEKWKVIQFSITFLLGDIAKVSMTITH